MKGKKIPASEAKLRSGKSQEIQYYLDANDSAQSQTLYHIKVEGNKVTARLKRLSPIRHPLFPAAAILYHV